MLWRSIGRNILARRRRRAQLRSLRRLRTDGQARRGDTPDAVREATLELGERGASEGVPGRLVGDRPQIPASPAPELVPEVVGRHEQLRVLAFLEDHVL